MANNPAIPNQVYELADRLAALPGIGPKSALRLAVYLTTRGRNLAQSLMSGLDVVNSIHSCQQCGGLSTGTICSICSDAERDKNQLLIVESAVDCAQIEDAEVYNGKYIILGGLISPLNGLGPDQLNLHLLRERLLSNDIEEVTLALPVNMEGEATSLYLQKLIEDTRPEIATFKLARGLPTGANIEYLDPQTLARAISGKTKIE